ncbi:MAG TPA: 50S ribosomal protein L11 methyltransferase [Gemmatimonadaceae bacterium]
MTWFSLRVESAAHRDEVMAALFAAGAQGVHEEGAALATSFPDEAGAEAAAGAVRAIDPVASCDVRPTAPVDWSIAWRDHARIVTSGDLTIAPPWLAGELDPARTIVIDPGMAFGTGDHASTRGAVTLLQEVMREGMSVADLGSGSAVLSITAARLGAAIVWAIEIDPEAQTNAAENVDRNAVSDVVHLLEGDAAVLLPIIAPVDVVTANILSSVIVELLPAMSAALNPGGFAVLAGILDSEKNEMMDELWRGEWALRKTHIEEEWWSALIQRP